MIVYTQNYFNLLAQTFYESRYQSNFNHLHVAMILFYIINIFKQMNFHFPFHKNNCSINTSNNFTIVLKLKLLKAL